MVIYDTSDVEIENEPEDRYLVVSTNGGRLVLCGGCIVLRTPFRTIRSATYLRDRMPGEHKCECPNHQFRED